MSVDHTARAEDLRWFAETGETLAGAAERLGLTTDGIEKWCGNHGARDVLERLRANEPGGRVRQGHVGLVLS